MRPVAGSCWDQAAGALGICTAVTRRAKMGDSPSLSPSLVCVQPDFSLQRFPCTVPLTASITLPHSDRSSRFTDTHLDSPRQPRKRGREKIEGKGRVAFTPKLVLSLHLFLSSLYIDLLSSRRVLRNPSELQPLPPPSHPVFLGVKEKDVFHPPSLRHLARSLTASLAYLKGMFIPAYSCRFSVFLHLTYRPVLHLCLLKSLAREGCWGPL